MLDQIREHVDNRFDGNGLSGSGPLAIEVPFLQWHFNLGETGFAIKNMWEQMCAQTGHWTRQNAHF
jgi:hypothetical protein